MDKSLQDAMEEFLDTTSYDKIPGKWQDVPAEDDNDEESVS